MTVDEGTKLLPVTVRVKAPPLTGLKIGSMASSVGAGLAMSKDSLVAPWIGVAAEADSLKPTPPSRVIARSAKEISPATQSFVRVPVSTPLPGCEPIASATALVNCVAICPISFVTCTVTVPSEPPRAASCGCAVNFRPQRQVVERHLVRLEADHRGLRVRAVAQPGAEVDGATDRNAKAARIRRVGRTGLVAPTSCSPQ
jgi:hypothetical protein